MLETVEFKADLCVIGGGLAGVFAAVAAAREGASVVLMQDRAVLGGNASSEIRMWVCGAQGKNVAETGILEELFMENLRSNPTKNHYIFDSLLWDMVKKEKNITPVMNCSCLKADMASDERIKSVTGWQMSTQKFVCVSAELFADCSGDSILAPLTGAHFRMGREAASEFGENVGTEAEDKKTMGNSCLLQAHKGTEKVKFTPPSFAKKLTAEDLKFRRPNMKSSCENFWYLELGGESDTIGDAENIRDELVALSFGMWDYIKNSGEYEDADYWQLDFAGFLPGKRESRRMVGKYLMTQNDITSDREFHDTAAFGGWPLDDHDPAGFYYDGHPNTSYRTPAPYAIPFRALYSENIENLLFAGRNISMTHAAMSSTRVMATCAVCGQAVGTAAALCKKYGTVPDEIYEKHLDELQETLLWNDCLLPHHPRAPGGMISGARLTLNGEYIPALEALRDGNDRENIFECEAGDEIGISFGEPADINEIRLIFDSDLDRRTLPGDECERKHMTRCNLLPDSPLMKLPTTLCSSFKLEAETADGKRICISDDSDNARRLVKIKADLKNISLLALTMREAHGGEKMRIFSIDMK